MLHSGILCNPTLIPNFSRCVIAPPTSGAIEYCGLRGVAPTSSRRVTTSGASCRRPTISSTAAMQRTWYHVYRVRGVG